MVFDPRLLNGELPSAKPSVVPTHGVAWRHKFPNWWGGATIASPTTTVTAPASQCVDIVFDRLGDLAALNEYYAQTTEYARYWVRKVLQVPESTPVIFDASGTAAILIASRILAQIGARPGETFWSLTTSEGGSLVPATLKGRNPNDFAKVMFQPTSSLFYEAGAVLPYPEDLELINGLIRIDEKTDSELVEEFRQAIAKHASQGPGCILLPHVTKTGRILPVAEISRMVADLRAAGKRIYLILDDIQGMGRFDAVTQANPLAICDAYLFGSSKALGGTLIASAVLLREEHLESFIEKVRQAGGALRSPWLAHFQFSPEIQERLGAEVLRPSAVSLPEIVAMRVGLWQLFLRGEGDTFAERRLSQLAEVQANRRTLVDGLTSLPGVSVLESSPEAPVVPSIVCFRADRVGLTATKVKDLLQNGTPIITPSAPISRYVRLDIPEYRSMPSVDVLVERLGEILA